MTFESLLLVPSQVSMCFRTQPFTLLCAQGLAQSLGPELVFAKLPLLEADFRLSCSTQYPYVAPRGIRSQDCWILRLSYSSTGDFVGYRFSWYKHIFKEVAWCLWASCLSHTGSELPAAHVYRSFNLQAKLLFLVFCGYSESGNRTFSYSCSFPTSIFNVSFHCFQLGSLIRNFLHIKVLFCEFTFLIHSSYCLKLYFLRNEWEGN